MRRLMLSGLVSLGLIGPVVAHHAGEIFQAGDLKVSHAWMHENAAMAHGSAVYLTIDNQGEAPDKLIGAEVDFADQVVFQAQTLSAEGVLEVRDVAAFQVAPGQVLTLGPGVVWLELQSIHRTFQPGEHFAMTLTFEQAGTVEIEVEIEPESHQPDPEDVS